MNSAIYFICVFFKFRQGQPSYPTEGSRDDDAGTRADERPQDANGIPETGISHISHIRKEPWRDILPTRRNVPATGLIERWYHANLFANDNKKRVTPVSACRLNSTPAVSFYLGPSVSLTLHTVFWRVLTAARKSPNSSS